MKNVSNLIVAAALLISGASLASVELDKDYKLLEPPQPVSGKQVAVQEFFFYGCSHCYNLHPKLVEWEKTMPENVKLAHVPVIFRDSMEPMARTFYALESLGQIHQLHDPLYRAWHVDNLKLSEETRILDFVSAQGVDRAKFSEAYNSQTTQDKVARAKQLSGNYKINGTPTLIVDGKYVITGLLPNDTIRVLKEVVALTHKAPSRSAEPMAKQPEAQPAPALAPAKIPVAAPSHAATPESTQPIPDQEFQPPLKLSNPVKPARTAPTRSRSLDLRHCLDLETNAAIIKCAGE